MGLKKWFDEKWVDISSPKKGGGYKQCGRKNAATSKRKYPKCVPQAKANRMSESQKRSAVTRKRAKAQGVGGKPTNVKTFARNGDLIVKPKLKLNKQKKGDRTFTYTRPSLEVLKKNKVFPNLAAEVFKEYDEMESPNYKSKRRKKGVSASVEGRYGGVRGSYSKDAKGNTQKKIEAELKFEFNKGGLMKTYYKGIL
tara:strand:+ start:423 stop:1013 length:591 start_codon:yes stop_codon:yes gene_type:complete